MSTREDDALLDLQVVDTHNTLFFFTNRGRVYPLRVFRIPGDTSRTTRGTALVNLLNLARGEVVQAMLSISDPKRTICWSWPPSLGKSKPSRRANWPTSVRQDLS